MKKFKAILIGTVLASALTGCVQEEAISYKISGGWPAYGDCINIYTNTNYIVGEVAMTPLDDGSYQVTFKVIPKESLSGSIG